MCYLTVVTVVVVVVVVVVELTSMGRGRRGIQHCCIPLRPRPIDVNSFLGGKRHFNHR